MRRVLGGLALVAAALLGWWAWAASPSGPLPPGVAARAELVRPLEVGAPAPRVTVRDAAGRAFDLGAAMEKGRSCLIFYRGGW